MPTTDAHPERVTHTGADESMDVAVIGTGHVGPITSVSMAIIGHRWWRPISTTRRSSA